MHYQTNIGLGELSAGNIRDLDNNDRALVFVRRAAAEIAYAAWLFADDATRAEHLPPYDKAATGQLARQLVASLAKSGFRWRGNTGSAAEKFLNTTRLGLVHGWRLAARFADADLTARHEVAVR